MTVSFNIERYYRHHPRKNKQLILLKSKKEKYNANVNKRVLKNDLARFFGSSVYFSNHGLLLLCH